MTPTADLTVHCLIRNEEQFIRPAILSILPLATRVLVYDTGSTDRTLEILSSIQRDLSAVPDTTGKLEIVHKTFTQPRELNGFRNEMIERTTTEWFMLVDGDEIYPADAVRRILEKIPAVPPTIHEIAIHRKHFVGSLNFISQFDRVGRIYRTKKVRWRTAYLPPYRFRADTPYLKDDPLAPMASWRMQSPEDIFFYHCQYLVRSSKDTELGALRRWRWRKPPFPVWPYLGPWPETLHLDGVAHRMTPTLLWTSVGLNAKILWTWSFTLARKLLKAE